LTILSVTEVLPDPHLGTRESNSSKNSTQGLDCLAFWNTSLTFYSEDPIYLSSNSGPFTDIKLMLNFGAIAEAKYVLPHPGGP